MQHGKPHTGTKTITAPVLPVPDHADSATITQALNILTAHPLNEVCWNEPGSMPEVHFVIAHHNTALFVKFYVKETSHRAAYTQTNDPVYKDSCVEFFIAPGDSGFYYNFEFNSLGTCLASYGHSRADRTMLNDKVIGSINRWNTWKTLMPEAGRYIWELTFVLTPEIFCYDHIKDFRSGNYRVNLYKCGDALPQPHYLAWNRIVHPMPDFHRPEFFVLLVLA